MFNLCETTVDWRHPQRTKMPISRRARTLISDRGLDCQSKDPWWFPSISKGFPGDVLKMEKVFYFYQNIKLYAISST